MRRNKPGKIKLRLRRERTPHKRLLFLVGLILMVIVIIIGYLVSTAKGELQNTETWALEMRQAPFNGKGTNYLVYGKHTTGENISIGEIFFLNYPLEAVYPHIIHIPNDLLLNRRAEPQSIASPEQAGEIDEQGETRNTFFLPAQLYAEGGARLLVTQFSYFLGVPVHYYLGIDYSGIPAMVDHLGGIEYRGELMQGEDYFSNFLQAGLGGKPSQAALRRMQMLSLLVEAVGEKRGLFSESRLQRIAARYLDTNMSWEEIKTLYPTFAPLFSGSEEAVTILPGGWHQRIDGEYYFKPDHVLISNLMANLGKDFILPRELVTVEILNGSGVAGAAAKAAALLQEVGYQVLSVGDAGSFDYARSLVISRQEEMGPARDIAAIIGAELDMEVLQNSPAMVTVIVGKNFSPE